MMQRLDLKGSNIHVLHYTARYSRNYTQAPVWYFFSVLLKFHSKELETNIAVLH